MKNRTITSTLIAAAALLTAAAGAGAATVTVTNPLNIPRPGETIELKWADVAAALPDVKAELVSVTLNGAPVVSQPLDLDGDGTPDQFIFQADFSPQQSLAFELKKLDQPAPPPLPKVYGRYVPERLDDFAWENDRTAFRVYGPALEKVEPGSSGVDAWEKSTRALVIDKWYKSPDVTGDKMAYHKDHGEGFDGYKVGHGRGAGGTAIWKDSMMKDSGFVGWNKQRVIANGPVRLVFELTYEPWGAGDGEKVGEVKRVTLDAGSNLNRFDSTFTTDQESLKPKDLKIAIGLSKHNKPGASAEMNKEQGWIRYWDAADSLVKGKTDGNIGTGVVIEPKKVDSVLEITDHVVLVANAVSGTPLTFYAGNCWDKSGDFKDVADWDKYLAQAAQRIAAPMKVSVEK